LDQRRFISFLMLSVAVMLLFSILFPAPPQPKQQPAPAGAQADGQQQANGNLAEDPARQQEADRAQQPAGQAPAGELPQMAAAELPKRILTLGSLDPTSGYRMLVMLTTEGGALRRAEMTSPRYRDQHDRSGYLGELELAPVDGGVEVQVVGAGTPAAEAGISVGDVIVGIGSPQTVEIKAAEDLTRALAATEPGQQITLRVRRSAGAPQPRTVKLMRRPFAVLRPEIENYQMRGAEPPPGFVDRPSFLLTLPQLNGKALNEAESARLAELLETGNWEVAHTDETSVTFRRNLAELNLEIIKRYTLQPAPPDERDVSEHPDYPAYHVQLDVELRNTSDAQQTLVYRLAGPTGMPLEGWWYAHKISRHRWFGGAGLRDVVVRFDGHSVWQIDGPQIAEGDVEPMGDGEALAYAGVDGQYFSAVMIPIRESLNEVWFDTTEAVVVGPPPEPRTPLTFTNVTCRMTRQALPLAAGATHRDSYQVFMGPKRPNLMAQYQAAGDPNYSLKDIIYYGLALFGAVAQAMLAILHFFYSIIGNYGIAIVMLTVLVRGAMFPISFKQTQNMARMQELKPEMDRISEKYKTDMQKRSQAIQELYRKHNINPLGGCLPVFLQLPIFIGLYRALMVDIELRNSPLFGHGIRWCSNLAAPDMFLDWSSVMPDFINSGQGIFGLGPYLNVLPLVTVALFLVTQKMAMPAPTTEQAVMQQKMMKYMTIFMGLLFYKVASGLCLYFIASSLWGIAERKLLPKAPTPEAAAAGGSAGTAPGSPSKRPGNGGQKPGPNGSPGQKRPPKAKRKK
jgi:YidC/Oxa1 family membrane protein insertase